MKTLLIIILGIALLIIGAISHEDDIERQCLKTGYSNSATWNTNLKCEVINPNKL